MSAKNHLKGITLEIGGNTAPLNEALQKVNNKSKELQQELRAVERLLKLDPHSAELLAQKQQLLTQSVEKTEEKLNALKIAQKQAQEQFEQGKITEEQYRTLRREIIQTEQQLNKLKQETDTATRNLNEFGDNQGVAKEKTEKLNKELTEQEKALKEEKEALQQEEKALKEAEEAQEKHKETVEKAKEKINALADSVKNLAKGLAIGVTAIAGAAAASGVYATKLSSDYSKALNKLASKTGAAKEEFKELEQSIENVFKNNFGESIEDVANAMSTVKVNTKLAGKELERATEDALFLRDTFEYDVNESTRSAKMLMEQFGMTSDEAYSMIVQGAQNGLDKNGDLLDTINEYSVHFAQLGIGAEDMFNMLANGADAGTFSVDKLGDGIKEFGIRTKDGSKGTTEALKGLGFDAKETMKVFAEGGAEAQAALELVNEKLLGMTDKVKQDAYGVMLYGTMWEDLGASGIKALQGTEGAIKMTTQALDEAKNLQFDNIESQFSAIGRIVQTDFVKPIGDEALPIFKEFTKELLDGSREANGDLSKLGGAFSSALSNLLSTLINNLVENIPKISGLGKQMFEKLLSGLMSALPSITSTATQVITTIIQIFKETFPKIIESGAQIIKFLADGLGSMLPTLLSNILDVIFLIFDTLIDNIDTIVDAGISIIMGLADGLIKALPKLIQKVPEIINKFWDAIDRNAIKLIKAGINLILKLIDGIIKSIPTLVASLPAIVEAIFKTIAHISWFSLGKTVVTGIKAGLTGSVNLIKSGATSIVSNAKNAFTKGFSNIGSIGKNVITAIKNGLSNAFGTLKTAIVDIAKKAIASFKNSFASIKDVGKNVVEGIWAGINSAAGWLAEKVKNFSKNILKEAKKALKIHSPSRAFKDEVGKQIVEGTAQGITENEKKATDAVKKTSKKMLEAAKKYAKKIAEQYKKDVEALNLKVSKENSSLTAQVKAWDKLRNKYKEGTDQRLKADKKYYDLKNKLDKENAEKEQKILAEKLAKDKKVLDTKKVYEEISAKNEMTYWNKARKKYKEGTEERIEADKMYFEAKKSYNEKLKSIEDDYASKCKQVNEELKSSIQSLVDEYDNSLNSRTNSIVSSLNLFEEFTKNSDVSGQQLLDNLKTQVNGIAEWTNNIQLLKDKKIDNNFIEMLQDLGVKSSGEIQALLSLTDKELNEYVTLWQTKNQLAKEQATKELESLKNENSIKIQELTEQANQQLQAYADEYALAMKEIGNTIKKPIEQVKATISEDGKVIIENLASSIKNNAKKDKVKKDISVINETIFNVINAINTNEIGSNIVQGLITGMKSQIALLQSTASQVINTALIAMQTKAEIHSPSRLFARKIGKPIAQGVGVGYEEEMQGMDLFQSINSNFDRNVKATFSTAGQGQMTQKFNQNTINIYTNNVDMNNIDEITNAINKKLGRIL